MEGPRALSDHHSEIPGAASVVEGNGGLPMVRVSSPDANGEIYLHGAHVTSWKPAGRDEVLFVSSQARWENGRAIRGGVPICFPWFGPNADDPKTPAHGFVRTKAWQLESIAPAEDGVTVSLFTESNEETRKWWPAEFHLAYRATFGRDLRLELVVTNTGKESLRFEEALHAYYRVGDIRTARLSGLQGVEYIDKTDASRKKLQSGYIAVDSETDRVYLNARAAIELDDPVWHRRTRVAKENSSTTVVWNPWVSKAQALADFADDECMRMICIETCNVSDFAVDLAPGQQHQMTANVTVADF